MNNSGIISGNKNRNEAVMLMNSKTIYFEIMKNDTLGFNEESNRKALPGSDSGDCSIRSST